VTAPSPSLPPTAPASSDHRGEPSAPTGRNRRRQQVWVVLPAFNEERDLPPLLERIADAMAEANLAYSVILVDDGSRDRTVEVARGVAAALGGELPLLLVEHGVNQGLGASIRDGLMKAAAVADPRDIVVTMDADNSHTPELILRMVRMIREGNDVVIASRYRPGARVRGVPWHRRVLSGLGRVLFTLVFPTPGVRDFTCGYRAYRAGLLQEAAARYGKGLFDQDGFQVMVDLLLKLRRMDVVFHEVPLILRYDLKEGASKMRVWRTIRNTLSLMARRRLGG
jgi:dolichol-phosphate mannosyltransferase